MALEQLADLARLAENELASLQLGSSRMELVERSAEERKARIDEPTGVWNRKGTLEVLGLSLADCADKDRLATVLACQIDELSQLGDEWTTQGSEIILSEVAQVLRGSIRSYDSIGRIEDDQFLLILAGLSEADAPQRVAYFQSMIDENPVLQAIGVRLHFGYACSRPTADAGVLAVDDVLRRVASSLASAREQRRSSVAA